MYTVGHREGARNIDGWSSIDLYPIKIFPFSVGPFPTCEVLEVSMGELWERKITYRQAVTTSSVHCSLLRGVFKRIVRGSGLYVNSPMCVILGSGSSAPKPPLNSHPGGPLQQFEASSWLQCRNTRLKVAICFLSSFRPDGFDFLDKWQRWIRHLTSPEHSKSPSEGCPRIGDAYPVVLVIPGYAPWKQISNLLTLASTQHGNTLRIENTGSTWWKPLRSSSGLARDDDNF